MCESTFSNIKQVKSKTEIEWHTKHRTVASNLLPLTYRYCQMDDSVREASTIGITLIEICNELFIAIV